MFSPVFAGRACVVLHDWAAASAAAPSAASHDSGGAPWSARSSLWRRSADAASALGGAAAAGGLEGAGLVPLGAEAGLCLGARLGEDDEGLLEGLILGLAFGLVLGAGDAAGLGLGRGDGLGLGRGDGWGGGGGGPSGNTSCDQSMPITLPGEHYGRNATAMSREQDVQSRAGRRGRGGRWRGRPPLAQARPREPATARSRPP